MINKNLANLTLVVFICFFFVSSRIGLAMLGNETIPVNVGVVLDDLDSMEGKAWLSCIKMALSDFYAFHSHYKTRLVLNVRDSNQNVVGAAAAGSPYPYKFLEDFLALTSPFCFCYFCFRMLGYKKIEE